MHENWMDMRIISITLTVGEYDSDKQLDVDAVEK